MKVFPTELPGRGAKDRSFITPPPSVFCGVGDAVYGRALAYPFRFNTLGTREIGLQGRTRKHSYKRNVRSELRTRVLDDVNCEAVPY